MAEQIATESLTAFRSLYSHFRLAKAITFVTVRSRTVGARRQLYSFYVLASEAGRKERIGSSKNTQAPAELQNSLYCGR